MNFTHYSRGHKIHPPDDPRRWRRLQRLPARRQPRRLLGIAADISVRREPAPGEAVVERDGVKLFLPAESRILLDGVTIDFADTPSQTGLVFRDPKQVSCSSH